MNAIEIKGLSKKYRDFELKNINITLPNGCIMGLVGENGAGKSTTIKLILDMIKRDEGTITVLGHDVSKSTCDLKEDIGVVLDEVGFPECLSAVQINRVLRNIYKNWNEDTFFNYLKQLAVPSEKEFKSFSRGTKMKLGIAAALSHSPKLLILDEATSGLDPVVRDEVVGIFAEFTRNENHSILISSHIVSDLEKICDYIAFLHHGQMILCEEKDRLYEKYALVHCTADRFAEIKPQAVIGKKTSSYGVEAVVEKSSIPQNIAATPVNIEELFVAMVKEDK